MIESQVPAHPVSLVPRAHGEGTKLGFVEVPCFAHSYLLPVIFSVACSTLEDIPSSAMREGSDTLNNEDATEPAKVTPTSLAPCQQREGLGLSSSSHVT